jgi:hypothetical protein
MYYNLLTLNMCRYVPNMCVDQKYWEMNIYLVFCFNCKVTRYVYEGREPPIVIFTFRLKRELVKWEFNQVLLCTWTHTKTDIAVRIVAIQF